jgi:transcriptional regulator with XRE-family HTH domain
MRTTIKKQLGKKIQNIRKAKGLSQEKLAELIGISNNSLSSIETGKSFMSFPNLERLIDVLNIKPYELFMFNNENPQKIILEDLAKKLDKLKNSEDKLLLISTLIDIVEMI